MGEIIITNATILDTREGALRSGQQIRISDTRIAEISAAVTVGSDATKIDAGGRIVMPGLIDTHVHAMACRNNMHELVTMPAYLVAAYAKVNLEDMLRRGFTSVRDAGGAEGGLAEAVRLNLFPGPRLFVPGLALAVAGGLGDIRSSSGQVAGCPVCRSQRAIARVVGGADEVRRAVREEMMTGAHQIKLMAGGGNNGRYPIETTHFSEDELRAAVDEAASFGTYVMAHAYGVAAIRRCLDAGVRTIEHANLIDAETARYVAEKKAYVIPTLATFEGSLDNADKLNMSPRLVRQVTNILRKGVEALRICRDAGVKLGFGTDLEGIIWGYQLREFAIRSEVETPAEILNSATVVNAEILMQAGELGELIPGALADLLILDGNPLEDLSIFREDGRGIKVTIKDGYIHKNEL
jgi:imidazolonepropionase-like amidohydrolase